MSSLGRDLTLDPAFTCRRLRRLDSIQMYPQSSLSLSSSVFMGKFRVSFEHFFALDFEENFNLNGE